MTQTIIICDTETTGLQHDSDGKDITKQNLILEIGLLAVRVPEFVEIAAWSTPIRYPKHLVLQAITDDFVLKMHTNNGLLGEIFNEPHPCNNVEHGGLPIAAQAENMALQFIAEYASDEKPELCGANPDFERCYFASHMPKLLDAFHYRNFDINSFWLIKKYLGDWDGSKGARQPHRAVLDCRRELEALVEFFPWIAESLGGAA
jgi:oligoribonuclease (3'-5' exoribonuclease)